MEKYILNEKENAKKATADEALDAVNSAEKFVSTAQTDKNIVENSIKARTENAASTLLEILSDYASLSASAKAKNDKNLATAALLTAKARVAVLKSELGKSVNKAETEYKKSYNLSRFNASAEKNKNSDLYNNLRINSLKSQIREG